VILVIMLKILSVVLRPDNPSRLEEIMRSTADRMR
jgi:hypothetical protein